MKSLLAFFSAPYQSANIVQAMAIQAHQPDVVIQIEASISGQLIIEEKKPLLEGWLEGSEAILGLYDDLTQPFKFPYTPPKGYIPRKGMGIPEVIKFKKEGMTMSEILTKIESDFPNHEYIFDLLPGAKMLKMDTLLHEGNSWKRTYTLEDGGHIQFGKEELTTRDGQSLSIIDRSWLAGFPIHVSMSMEEIHSKQALFSAVMNSCYIEKLGFEEQERMENVMRNYDQRARMKAKIDRPLGLRSHRFRQRFEDSGGKVSNQSQEGMDLTGPNGEFWKIEFFQNTVPNGVPFESLVVNEICKSWNCDEVFQGISIIHPTAEMREKSFRNLFEKMQDRYFKHPGLEHEAGPFKRKCEELNLTIDSPLDTIIAAEYERLNETNDDENLIFIRVCEIDILTLDAHGICSFDAKQIMRKYNPSQANMQKPAFLFNKPDSNYFVVGSTSHDVTSHDQTVIHISNLHQGRDVLYLEGKHEWTPNKQDLEDLRLDFFEAMAGFRDAEIHNSIDTSKTLAENLQDFFSTEIGISWDLMVRFLFEKKLNAVETVMNLEDPLTMEFKNELIRFSITYYEEKIAKYEEKIAKLSDKIIENKIIENKIQELENQRKEKINDLSRLEKEIELLNATKREEKKLEINQDELTNRLAKLVDKRIRYELFKKNLADEGIKTKGIKKKIKLVVKANNWEFHPKGKKMIRSKKNSD